MCLVVTDAAASGSAVWGLYPPSPRPSFGISAWIVVFGAAQIIISLVRFLAGPPSITQPTAN